MNRGIKIKGVALYFCKRRFAVVNRSSPDHDVENSESLGRLRYKGDIHARKRNDKR